MSGHEDTIRSERDDSDRHGRGHHRGRKHDGDDGHKHGHHRSRKHDDDDGHKHGHHRGRKHDDDDGDSSVITTRTLNDFDSQQVVPTLTVNSATGNEDSAIVLDIAAALAGAQIAAAFAGAQDAGTVLTVTISGAPAGAVLSAGIDNGDGTWTLTSAQLTGLTITPPANSDQDFILNVSATSADAENAYTTTKALAVTVDPVADAPTLSVTDAEGKADSAIALDAILAPPKEDSEIFTLPP